MKRVERLTDEFRAVMKGFDMYLEQSPNPRELKAHIAAALKLNGQIHRRAALEDAAREVAGRLHNAEPRFNTASLPEHIRAIADQEVSDA